MTTPQLAEARTPPGLRPDRHVLPIVQAMAGAAILKPSAEIERHDRRYRNLLDALDVAVYTTDAAGRITFFNRAATGLWGRRPALGEEWCGSWRLYWPDGRPMRHSECPMAIALGEDRAVRGMEAVAERPDGTRVQFLACPTPLHDDGGGVAGAVNVLVDVTERRRAEAALRASDAVKDEFLGLVSHELRTPLTTIFGNAQLLSERIERLPLDEVRSMLDDIALDSSRLLGIVENLLVLTRLEAGAERDTEPQVLERIVQGAAAAYRRRNPERSVTVETESIDAIVVEADRTYLELLVENLLSNADKYSPAGTEIEMKVGTQGPEAVVRVLDRGMGIRESEATAVFAPFFRSEAAKRRASGMGLGLAVCRRLVESHGGRIWATPRAGGGSEFAFSLPLLVDSISALS